MAADVYELTMDAPGMNALSSAHMTGLLRRLAEADERPLLLTGTGKAFSAGLDLREVAGLDRAGMERFLLLLDDLIDALWTYPAPTVACVNGHAIAGGCVLVLCCDGRIARADPTIRIGLNEVPLGLEFPPKILALVRHRLSPRWIERLLLEGTLHDPATAQRLGFVDEVTADAPARARALLAELAARPRATYAATKRALHAGVLDLTDTQRRDFRERVVPAWVTPAVKAGVRAALERRR